MSCQYDVSDAGPLFPRLRWRQALQVSLICNLGQQQNGIKTKSHQISGSLGRLLIGLQAPRDGSDGSDVSGSTGRHCVGVAALAHQLIAK